MQWYYSNGGVQMGPVSTDELRAKLVAGEVQVAERVWKDGMKDWLPVSMVEEFKHILPGTPPSIPGGSPYQAPAWQGSAYVPTPTSGLAIASLICGIVGLVLCMFFPGIPNIAAVICGHMALSRIRNSPVPIEGRGMAIAGLITGYVGIGMIVISLLFFATAVFA